MILGLVSSPAYATEVNIGDGAVVVDEEGVRIGDSITVDEGGVRLPGVEVETDAGGTSVAVDGSREGGGVAWQGGNIQGGNYGGQDFTGKVFANIEIDDADFSGANLSGAKFTNVEITNTDFSNTDLSGVEFTNSSFDGVRFDNANFSFARVTNGDFTDVQMRGTCLLRASFSNSDFTGGDLTGAYTVGVSFTNVDYDGTLRDNMVGNGPESCPGWQVSQPEPTPPPVTPVESPRPELTSADRIEKALVQGKGSEISLTVNFEHDSDKITGAARAQIFEIAKALKSDQVAGMRVRVEGHTDSTGEDAYNADLSYRRALSVIKSLTRDYEISDKNLEISGLGESRPIADNNTEVGRAINRRVTLVNLGPAGG